MPPPPPPNSSPSPSCFSFTSTSNSWFKRSFSSSGLKSTTTDLGDGTAIHCWAPKSPKPTKPNLLLIHGIGANAMWQWSSFISSLTSRFNLYVPDLLFFGESHTTRPERTESFQAQCVMRAMEALSTSGAGFKASVVGLSYGGFVAYSMASMYGERIDRVVIACSGVCMEEIDLERGMFRVNSLEEAVDILLARTPKKLRELMRLAFYKPFKNVPTCFLSDFIDVPADFVCRFVLRSNSYSRDLGSLRRFLSLFSGQVMNTENFQERKELIYALHQGRKLSDLPVITQPTMIIWGEHDQIFPIELGHRLKRHLGGTAELVILKKAGHAINMEKSKEFYRLLKSFLLQIPAAGNNKARKSIA